MRPRSINVTVHFKLNLTAATVIVHTIQYNRCTRDVYMELDASLGWKNDNLPMQRDEGHTTWK